MTLREQLVALAASSASRLPPDVLVGIDRMIADLAVRRVAAEALAQGQMLPDFALPGASGVMMTTDQLVAAGPSVIVFYRGEWCPYCTLQLRALGLLAGEFRRAGITLAAIGPAAAEAKMESLLGFPLLHDRGNKVARSFGLVWELSPDLVSFYRSRGLELPSMNGTERWELPFAASYVVRRDRTVAFAKVDIDFRQRAEPADLLAIARRSAAEPAMT